HHVGPIGTARNTHQRTTSMRIPIGRSQPYESRNQINTARIRNLLRQGFRLGRSLDELQTVPNPLDCRAADKDRPFQGVNRLAMGIASQCGQKFVLGKEEFLPQVQQQETSGTISVFQGPGCVTTLSEEGRLLISGDTADLNTPTQITTG